MCPTITNMHNDHIDQIKYVVKLQLRLQRLGETSVDNFYLTVD